MKKEKYDTIKVESRQSYRDNWEDPYDVAKFMMTIHSKIEDITPDFVMAKTEQPDETYIIEMKQNAFILTNLMNLLRERQNNRLNEQGKYDQEYEDAIKEHIINVAEIYMLRPKIIVNMRRNKPNNPIFGYISGMSDKAREEDEEREQVEKFLDKFKPEKR